MANDTILQAALMLSPSVIRKEDALVRRVYSDVANNPTNGALVGAQNDVITCKVPLPIAAGNVTAGTLPTTAATFASKALTLSYWREAGFQITDGEFADQIKRGLVPAVMQEAIKSVVGDVNTKIHDLCWYKFPNTRTADGTIDDLIAIRTALNKAGVPKDQRSYVFSSGLDAKYQGVFNGPAVVQADPNGVRTGDLAPRMGLDLAYDQSCDDDDAFAGVGTMVSTDNPIVKAGTTPAIGDTTITITNDANGRTVAKGQVFTFAGDTQQYAVTAAATITTGATGAAISISPPLRTAVAASSAVTIVGTTGAVVSMAFHKYAINLVSRVPKSLTEVKNADWASFVDPQTGLVLTLLHEWSHYLNTYSVGCLYGVEVGADPNLGMKIHYTS